MGPISACRDGPDLPSGLNVVESIVLIECYVSEVLTMCTSGTHLVESIVLIEWSVSELLAMCTSGTQLVESIVKYKMVCI